MIRSARNVEEARDGLNVIEHYFGADEDAKEAERFLQWIELERMHLAVDGDRVVGGAGAFTYRLSVPGGDVPAAGVTVVGVLPSHRRRGILTELMREQFADARRRGEPVAYLWASESTIYPRFGYGLAARFGHMRLARERTRFALAFEPRGTVRLVDEEAAARLFPPLYERVYAQRPGMVTRSEAWWTTRRLHDLPERRKGSPLNRALLELDGEPAGYALYRVKQEWGDDGGSSGTVTIGDAIAPTPEAERELWRWLLDFDWTAEFKAELLPLDHPLFLLLAEPRRMRFHVDEGTWVRLVDVEAALAARTYGDGEVVLEVEDAFLPENAGRYRVSAAGCERVEADADLRLDVTALASVYLGGFGFDDLRRASRLEELPGAVERADALFASSPLPWCAEIF